MKPILTVAFLLGLLALPVAAQNCSSGNEGSRLRRNSGCSENRDRGIGFAPTTVLESAPDRSRLYIPDTRTCPNQVSVNGTVYDLDGGEGTVLIPISNTPSPDAPVENAHASAAQSESPTISDGVRMANKMREWFKWFRLVKEKGKLKAVADAIKNAAKKPLRGTGADPIGALLAMDDSLKAIAEVAPDLGELRGMAQENWIQKIAMGELEPESETLTGIGPVDWFWRTFSNGEQVLREIRARNAVRELVRNGEVTTSEAVELLRLGQGTTAESGAQETGE
jgi:hypothetical protein